MASRTYAGSTTSTDMDVVGPRDVVEVLEQAVGMYMAAGNDLEQEGDLQSARVWRIIAKRLETARQSIERDVKEWEQS